jgi:hypothetical protein
MPTLAHYVLGWLGLLAIAMANGALREGVYGPHMAELAAHQLSTVLALLLFTLYIGWFTARWPLPSADMATGVGALWLGLTLAFEFGFFHYVMGHPWSRLLRDYDISAGRLWVLIPLWTAVAPYVFYRLRSQA